MGCMSDTSLTNQKGIPLGMPFVFLIHNLYQSNEYVAERYVSRGSIEPPYTS